MATNTGQVLADFAERLDKRTSIAKAILWSHRDIETDNGRPPKRSGYARPVWCDA